MGMVVTYAPKDGDGITQHEIATRVAVAKALAALKGFEFAGGYEPSLHRGKLYAPLPAGPLTKYTLVETYGRSF